MAQPSVEAKSKNDTASEAASNSLADCEVLFVDCQTTGSSPTNGGLLELAFARASAKTELPEITYCILQQPYNVIPDRISELTGITADDLEHAVTPRHASQVFRAALGQTPRCVIHYAKFELPFLRSLMFDPLINYRDCDEIDFSVFCTHEIVRRLYPNFPARGIKAIAGFFGQRLQPLKRASSHVHATWLIWKCLVEALADANIKDEEQLKVLLSEPFTHKRGKYEYPLNRQKRLGLPNMPGVYRMLDRHGEILYVGKATSLKSRVNSYFRGQRRRDPELLEMLAQVSDIDVTTCDTVIEAAVLESDEIKLHNPPYNAALKETGRHIFFVSRDFKGTSAVPDDVHTLGPFTSSWSLDRLQRFCEGARSNEFQPRIFMDYIEPQLMQQGFRLFCEKWSVSAEQMSAVRSCIALGARLMRAEARGELQLETDLTVTRVYGQLHIDTLRTGTAVFIKPQKFTYERAIDAEEVSCKIARLLARVAQNYLRCRRLTRLLNCNIVVETSDGPKTITMVDGMLHRHVSSELKSVGMLHRHVSSELKSDGMLHRHVSSETMTYAVKAHLAWNGKTIADYDRISVLFKELQRVKHRVSISWCDRSDDGEEQHNAQIVDAPRAAPTRGTDSRH